MDFMLHEKDLSIEQGDFVLCPTDSDALAQTISTRLKILAGEWFLDESLGIPYFTGIFGQKRNERFIRQVVLPEIQTIPGISSINDFQIEEFGRTLRLSFTAIADGGFPIQIKEAIGL
jgi:hypothetical protein